MTNELPNKPFEWANLTLGLCLACAGFAFVGVPAAAWNAGIVGALIVYCSGTALRRYGDWAEWSNLGLGCWAVVAPLFLSFGSMQLAITTHVLIGVAVASIASVQLLASYRAQAASSRPTAARR